MKKIGDVLTMRGKVDQSINGFHLPMFDGSFETGYVIESFIIAATDVTSTNELMAKLHTSETTSSISVWDWADNQEIAWAAWGIPNPAYVPQEINFIDPENLIIQDLYLSTYGTGENEKINYMIQLQKYSISDWAGALATVRNRAQT